MPALKTTLLWKKELQWNVGSDDFVIPALLAIVIRLVCFALTVGILIYLYFPRSECDSIDIPPFLYGSLFALLLLEAGVMINDAIVFSISARGTMYHNHPERPHPRRLLPYALYIRVFVFFLEVVAVIMLSYAVFSPEVAGSIDCDDYQEGPIAFTKALAVILWVTLILYFVGFMFYIDPIGLCSPGLLPDMKFLEKDLEQRDEENQIDGPKQRDEENQIDGPKFHHSRVGQRAYFRRFKALCCCLGIGGNRSRSIAVNDVARAFYTIFSDLKDVVPSDMLAGLILVNRDQQKKMRECRCLISDFRKLTFDSMPESHKPDGYVREDRQEFDFTSLDESVLFDDLVHYMQFSMGIYGWPLHIFNNLACGLCQLSTVTCCVCNFRCWNQRAKAFDFHLDNVCLCGVGSLRLQATIPEDNILYVTYENEVFQAPFSVCLDHERRTVVITVRGTLSVKDALTDMSVSMKKLKMDIPGYPSKEAYVHRGMHETALWVKDKIVGKDGNKKVLDQTFADLTYQDYQLVVTGHSLGAGVASILAVLLKPQFPDLVCYAFSAPGCIFSFPLAVYSRKFITSVVLGNDLVPRVTMRSLQYLKKQLVFLLRECQKPKHQVIFQPRWMDRFIGKKEDPSVDLEHVRKEITPQYAISRPSSGLTGFIFAKKAAKKLKAQIKKGTSSHYFAEVVNSGERVASFPPGKVIHLQVDKNARPWCLGACYPSQMKVSRVSSEDFCVILIDNGAVEDHLPNEVLAAMRRCKKQLMRSYSSEEIRRRREELIQQFSQQRQARPSEKSSESDSLMDNTASVTDGGRSSSASVVGNGVRHAFVVDGDATANEIAVVVDLEDSGVFDNSSGHANKSHTTEM